MRKEKSFYQIMNYEKYSETTKNYQIFFFTLVKIIKDKHFGVFKTQIFDTDNNLVVDGTGTALNEEKL